MHVDICFVDSLHQWAPPGQGVRMFTIIGPGDNPNVQCRAFEDRRQFSRDEYEWLHIICTDTQAQTIYNWCHQTARSRKHFDGNLLSKSIMPFGDEILKLLGQYTYKPLKFEKLRKERGEPPSKGYFCSMLITEALQSAGLLPNVVSKYVTPTDLYMMCREQLETESIHKGV